MNKVTTINLNGRAYQIEEAGYAALNKYLNQAEAQLLDNPDREEIVADFEQAIAEKCDQILSANKSVVTEKEMKAIITQMGPVDGQDEEHAAEEPTAVKRLYLIKEGAIIGGVCNGIAAYFNVDVTVVRLITLVLAFVTSGAVVAAYLILMFLIPEAKTPEERAAAQGASFNSKALLDSARRKYAVLGDGEHWHKVARENKPVLNSVGSAIRKVLRFAAGVVAAFGVVALLGIVVAGISAIWSLLFNNNLYGFVTLDPTISTSLFALLVGCALVVGAVPVFLVTIICLRYAKSGSIKQNIWAIVSALVLFAVALGVGIAIFSTIPQVRTMTVYHKSATSADITKVCIGNCPPDPYPQADFKQQIDEMPAPMPAPMQP